MFNLWKNSGGGTKLSTYNLLSQNKNTRIQNLNARATAISLNSIDEKIRRLEGTSRAVPIDMKSLDDRINNLIATAKSWEIVTLNKSGSSYPFDSKYANWDFLVVSGQILVKDKNTSITKNKNSISTRFCSEDTTFSWSKSGNSIVVNQDISRSSSSITVLFYK